MRVVVMVEERVVESVPEEQAVRLREGEGEPVPPPPTPPPPPEGEGVPLLLTVSVEEGVEVCERLAEAVEEALRVGEGVKLGQVLGLALPLAAPPGLPVAPRLPVGAAGVEETVKVAAAEAEGVAVVVVQPVAAAVPE